MWEFPVWVPEYRPVRHQPVGTRGQETAVAVGDTGCFHGSRCVTKVLEHRGLPVLIHDVVALEDNAALELAARVAGRNVRIFSTTKPNSIPM